MIEVMALSPSTMRVEQLNEGMWAMTYLVVCEDSKKATLIDPVWDNLGDYLSLLEEQGLELEYAMATHTHADLSLIHI